MRERNDPACASLRIFGRMPVDGKRFRKAADGFLPDAVLNMEIMLSHIHIRVPYDALNGGKVHAKRLHLRNIGVSAGIGCQLAHAFDLFENFPKFIPEIGGVARSVLLALLTDEFRIDLTKLPCAPAQIGRHGYITINVRIRLLNFLIHKHS